MGIDVGGTKIALGLVDVDTGKIECYRQIPTLHDSSPERSLAEMTHLARQVAQHAAVDGRSIAAIGLGVPEVVSVDGFICSAHTLNWTNDLVNESLAPLAPVTLCSDVQAAAVAEATIGSGAGYSISLYISIGTGISHTLVLDGISYRGATGGAILFGCSAFLRKCSHCGAAEERVLEHFASGPALVQRFIAAGGSADDAEAVIVAAAAGDRLAGDVVRTAAEDVGQEIGHLVNVLDPEIVIIGGGLGSGVTGLYWDQLVANVRRVAWSHEMKKIPIVQAAFSARAGVIGAAIAAVHAQAEGATQIIQHQRDAAI